MNNVTSLDQFRLDKAKHVSDLRLDLEDVVGRDYTQMDHVIHAILRIKKILTHHVGPVDLWPSLLLDILGVVENTRRGELEDPAEALSDACLALREHIEDCVTTSNQLDMGSALVLLSFVANSQRMKDRFKN